MKSKKSEMWAMIRINWLKNKEKKFIKIADLNGYNDSDDKNFKKFGNAMQIDDLKGESELHIDENKINIDFDIPGFGIMVVHELNKKDAVELITQLAKFVGDDLQ